VIEPKYTIGERVIVTIADDMFTGAHATIRSWKRHRKPYWRISYVLDIDGRPMKWGAGPYSEDELTKEQRVNITQITVSYGETQSLPEYSNVKPALTLTAVLNDGELAEEVETELWKMAKESVREQIDLALEANGKAAKWSGEPRYQVMQTYWNRWDHRGEKEPPQYVIILPNNVNPDRDSYAQRLIHASNSIGDARKLRYEHALRIAAEVVQERGYTLLDCSTGDLSRLEAVLPPKPTEAPPVADDLSDEDRRGYQQADDEEDDRGEDEDDE